MPAAHHVGDHGVAIKRDLLDPSRCSEITVQLVQDVLGVKPDTAGPVRPQSRSCSEIQVTHPAKSTERRTIKSAKTARHVQVLEQPQALSSAERRKLATEIVNISLITLTKSTPLQEHNGARTGSLVERSPNHQSKSVSAASASKSNQGVKASNAKQDNSKSVAQCCRAAFSCLRALSCSTSDLQLEHGMVALIGRMISLNYLDLAQKELQILKTRLHTKMSDTAKTLASEFEPRNRSREREAKRQGETLASLLHFQKATDDTALLSMVIGHQMLVLRVIGLANQRAATEAALSQLESDSGSSPSRLIRELRSLTGDSDRAALQMNTLASSIAPRPPVSLSVGMSGSEKCWFHSAVHFRLQTLSFRFRLRAMQFSGCKASTHDSIWRLFAKKMIEYAKGSLEPSLVIYATASQCYNALRNEHDEAQTGEQSASPTFDDTCLVLSQLAEASGLMSEAITHVIEALSYERLEKSSMQRVEKLARLVTLRFDHGEVGSTTAAQLEIREAVTMISSKLSKSRWRDESTIRVAAALQTSAARRLKTLKDSAEGNEPLTRTGLVDGCHNVLCAGHEWLDKIASDLSPFRPLEVSGSFPMRELSNSAGLSIGYVIDQCSNLDEAKIDHAKWLALSSSLARSTNILRLIAAGPSTAGSVVFDNRPASKSWLLALSNAHYRIHHACKLSLPECSTSSLENSCNVLLRADDETKKQGKLTLKLSKLAQIQEDARHFAAAAKSYLRCVRMGIELGTLQEVLSGGDLAPLSSAWRSKINLRIFDESLCRCLELNARHDLGLMDGQYYLDIVTTDVPKRGLLLEQQLRIILSWAPSVTLKPFLQEILSALVPTALDLYEAEKMRTPLLRLSLRALRMMLDAPTCVSAELNGCICRSAAASLAMTNKGQCGNDSWVIRYLQASIKMILVLEVRTGNAEALREGLSTWHSLLDEYSDLIANELGIDELEAWQKLATHISACCELDGLLQQNLHCLRLLTRLKAVSGHAVEEPLPHADVSLALQLLHLGYSEHAKLELDHILKTRWTAATSQSGDLTYHLTRAEHALTEGDAENCHEYLEWAKKKLFGASQQTHGTRLELRAFDMFARADYYSLTSRFLYLIGNTVGASYYGKLELQCLQAFWKALEARDDSESKAAQHPKPRDDNHDLSTALASLNLSVDGHGSDSSSRPKNMVSIRLQFPIMSRLCRAFRNIARLSSENGDYVDAAYHLTQAERLVSGVSARHLVAGVLVERGYYDARGDQLDGCRIYLDRAAQIYDGVQQTKEVITYLETCGQIHHLHGQWLQELDIYRSAEKVLDRLTEPDFVASLPTTATHVGGPRMTKKITTKPAKAKPTKRTNKARMVRTPPTATFNDAPKAEPAQFSATRVKLMCLIGESLFAKADFNACREIVTKIHLQKRSPEVGLKLNVLRSHLLAGEALALMSEDAMFNMLTESTLSIPAILEPLRRVEHRTASPSSLTVESKTKAKTASAGKTDNVNISLSGRVAELLREAVAALPSAHEVNGANYPRAVVDPLLASLGSLSMMLSYATPKEPADEVRSASVALCLNSSSISSGLADRHVALADQLLKACDPDGARLIADRHSSSTPARIQSEVLEMLPDAWTLVSMSLDETADHMFLTRFKAGRTPFVVRLPLTRQNENTDEDIFSFADARTELEEVIAQSEATVHSARDNPDQLKKPGARRNWWVEREDLDGRLKELLHNIENMWLGGFRGLFSQHSCQTDLVARFQQSFENTLSKHLPSRQKSSKQDAGERIKLDRHVLELFVGLYDPEQHAFDLDEALTDLLYYVVDILQFNGEFNAYDEIDFDAVIVEVHSALQSYHEASRNLTSGSTHGHTILVLDKQLHAFPWESLPCLDGQSVSRVHSLLDVHERMRAMTGSRKSGMGVSASRGSYILNPSGDLKRTQSRFERLLRKLSSDHAWSGNIDTLPTSESFVSSLSDDGHEQSREETPRHRVLLYFGHGSGAQYVKHRHIKALRYKSFFASDAASSSYLSKGAKNTTKSKVVQCSDSSNPDMSLASALGDVQPTSTNPTVSVPLLFGCSSASLRLHGEFEPAGTPKTYMCAGAPALLGSLWDVTDGDLDKFAGATLERWGLFQRGAFEREEARLVDETGKKKDGLKARAKGKRPAGEGGGTEEDANAEDDWGRMSLSGACAQSRKNCYLKYLNGAAMVVYGVPVYLDKPIHG